MGSIRVRWGVLGTVLALVSGTAQAGLKVGLVLDRGGKDDKSFNQAAYQGSLRAQKELGIELKTVESTDTNSFEPLLRTFAQHGYDLIIGVDSNQDWIKPGFVLTSMLKRVDVAVFETIKATQGGGFASGTARYGLANEGVDYSLDDFNRKLLAADVLTKVDDLKKQIIAGKIHVPDYYKRNAKN
ncbi:MAG TPA: BMP family ABC transporter substrate-binding protein [Bdellovibrionota bacterium]|nr:BMP family ABC transporter substrate-binding protein [Bdellovibrionota bacterium]